MSSLGLHQNGPFNIKKWMKEGVEAFPFSAEYLLLINWRMGWGQTDQLCTHREPHYLLFTSIRLQYFSSNNDIDDSGYTKCH